MQVVYSTGVDDTVQNKGHTAEQRKADYSAGLLPVPGKSNAGGQLQHAPPHIAGRVAHLHQPLTYASRLSLALLSYIRVHKF